MKATQMLHDLGQSLWLDTRSSFVQGIRPRTSTGGSSFSASPLSFPPMANPATRLIFVIARGDPDPMLNEHRAISGAMTNIKSHMANGKWRSLLDR